MKRDLPNPWKKLIQGIVMLSILMLWGFPALSQTSTATVTTDKDDYVPGETAIITGTGWSPGEIVELDFEHIEPNIPDHEHDIFEVTADANGNIYFEFYIGEEEIGTTFHLMARGRTSGLYAETFFTDGNFIWAASGLPNGVGITVSYNVSGSGPGSGAQTRTFTTPSTASQNINNRVITLTSYSPNSITEDGIKYQVINYTLNSSTGLVTSFNSLGGSVTTNFRGNYGVLISNDQLATYGNSVTLTATFYSNYISIPKTTISGKTINFYINGTSVGTGVTNASGVASLTLDLTAVPTLGKLNVGTYDITTSFAGDSGFLAVPQASSTGSELEVTQRPITITADAKSKIYGDLDPALTAQVTAGTIVSGDVATGSLIRVAGENVGTYAINKGTYTFGANYLETYTGALLTINQLAVAVTADAKSKTYGEVDPALTFVSVPAVGSTLANGEVVGFTGALSRAAGENVGTYAINQNTVANGNYAISYTGALLTINQLAVAVTADAKSKTYGEVDPALTFVSVPAVGSTLANGEVVGFTGALSRAAGENVGTYAINQNTVANGNYAISYTGALLTITKASIIVVNTSRSKVFGATLTNADYTGSITGVVAGDNITVTRASAGDPAAALVGQYPIIGTLVDPDGRLDNYNVSNPNGVLTVIKDQTTLVYSGDVSEQYSDVTDLRATLTANLFGTGIAGKTIKFTIGSQSVTAITNSSGVATATLKLTQSPIPSYNVVTEFAADAFYESSSDTDAFDITQENANVEYTGQEFVGVNSSTATTTPVLLSASINDIADGVGLEGDIRNARVQFYDVNTNAAISGWLTPGLVTPGDFTKGIVNHSWNAPVPSSGYNSTTVGIRVGTQSPEANGFYIGRGQTVINVYRVSLVEFITGGGHIIPADSKGEYASDVSRKVNFGYNVKWNKSVKNLQGNFNLVFRRGDRVYQIRSTAMNSLSIVSTNPCSQKATFTTKANLTDVTNPNLPVSIYGGITLEVTMTDNGEPGRTDMIGITLLNGNNLIFSSSWPVNKTLESYLAGGNLVVHNGVKCTVTGTTTTAITSTKNPSNLGDVVTFKATVTGAVTVPTGTITFKNGTSVLGVVNMVSGTASFTTSSLALGDHQITALYSGDSKFLSSIGSLTQRVVSLSARVMDGQKANDLLTVDWNTPVETIKKKVDQMSKGWFEGSSVAMRWNLDAYDGRTPGFYQVVGEPVSGNLSDLQNIVEIPVLVREKPLATDILATVKVIPSNVELGQVFTKLITVDKVDDIHTYQVSENDYFELVDDQLVWKSAAVPAELRLTVTSTDRAGQSIERELVFRKGAGNNGNFDIPAASSVSEVIVHPNPAREQFANVQVRLSQAAKVNLRVYDPQGRLVYQDEAYEENSFMRTLDLKGYSNGLYMILVQVDNQLITKRLIKE